ncbi:MULTISPECIES: M23 family metallopeptidase [Streptomyces]|uniref:M23 family metallopeptidase n=1 Tax=Streptomyces TaxID=1883 RepID=UPI001316DECD|nr:MULTISPECIES: M23 family metallopeptidase [Streptomyces]QGZ50541.1 peptidoglycan DD-metalloendopeptidase family protein [Streptomyces sp. QHH-9511]GGT89375.1 peptidase [Streptomyces lateritius]
MNDQHPHAGYVGDDAHSTGNFATDPLFGAFPGGYEAGHSGQYDTTQWNGSHQWDAGSYDTYVAQQPTARHFDATAYDSAAYDTTGQWDAAAWTEAQQTGTYGVTQFTSYDTTGQWTTPTVETGTYDATAWNYAEPVVPQQYTPAHEFVSEPEAEVAQHEQHGLHDHGQHEQHGLVEQVEHTAQFEALATDSYAYDHETPAESEEPVVEMLAEPPAAAVPAARPVRRSSGGSRGRRRTPAKRSALLTVAVPSACVMGVAGIAAASVGGLADASAETKDDTMALTAADPSSVKPVAANNELDTQLAALSADARDFGDRASRTQERIDLKLRQEAERKKREEEAARKEALRPKFVLPVKLHQLSARYGQAGVNWMSLHTGIDFPVQYGTKVMAATDGTVRTQWNSAYGNMAIVTAADGTETWYCHLSSTKIRSGKVKAGDVIAYSGNSGNSTGPHLHFEVRPGGGAAIDPLPWLRSHGIDPTG